METKEEEEENLVERVVERVVVEARKAMMAKAKVDGKKALKVKEKVIAESRLKRKKRHLHRPTDPEPKEVPRVVAGVESVVDKEQEEERAPAASLGLAQEKSMRLTLTMVP